MCADDQSDGWPKLAEKVAPIGAGCSARIFSAAIICCYLYLARRAHADTNPAQTVNEPSGRPELVMQSAHLAE